MLIKDRNTFRIAFWASMARLVGVCLGSGMGSLLYQSVGPGAHSWGVAALLGIAAVALLIYSEYERAVAQVTHLSGEPGGSSKAKQQQELPGEPAPNLLRYNIHTNRWE